MARMTATVALKAETFRAYMKKYPRSNYQDFPIVMYEEEFMELAGPNNIDPQDGETEIFSLTFDQIYPELLCGRGAVSTAMHNEVLTYDKKNDQFVLNHNCPTGMAYHNWIPTMQELTQPCWRMNE